MKRYFFTDGFVYNASLDAKDIKLLEKSHGPLKFVKVTGVGTIVCI